MSGYLTLALIACLGVSALTEACDPNPDIMCTQEFAQVCATFTKTFPNACAMSRELCGLAQQGFHFIKSDDGNCCTTITPTIYIPTCASNGKTYVNWWAMNNEACAEETYLTEAPPTTCSDYPQTWLKK